MRDRRTMSSIGRQQRGRQRRRRRRRDAGTGGRGCGRWGADARGGHNGGVRVDVEAWTGRVRLRRGGAARAGGTVKGGPGWGRRDARGAADVRADAEANARKQAWVEDLESHLGEAPAVSCGCVAGGGGSG
jgi:hypothetical protein